MGRRMYFVVLDHLCDRMIDYIAILPPEDSISTVLQEVSRYVYRFHL